MKNVCLFECSNIYYGKEDAKNVPNVKVCEKCVDNIKTALITLNYKCLPEWS